MAAKKLAPDTETEPGPRDTTKHQTQIIDHDLPSSDIDLSYLDYVTPTHDPLTGETRGGAPAEQKEKAETGEQKPEQEPPKEGETPAVEVKPPEAPNWEDRYNNAQRKISEQGAELGQLRGIVDQHIMSGSRAKREPAPVDKKSQLDRFLDDPDAVIREIKDEATQQALAAFQGMQTQNKALGALDAKHPDRLGIVNSPEFRDWIPKSGIPFSVIKVAETDPEAAAYVLDNYKGTIKKPPEKPAQNPKVVADQLVTKRRMAANASGVGGSSGTGDGEKIYTRYELIKMQTEDPEQYEVRQPEIMRAYQEGRVR